MASIVEMLGLQLHNTFTGPSSPSQLAVLESSFVTVVVWCFCRGIAAIVGEYAKRVWFKKLWKDEVARGRNALESFKIQQRAKDAEYETVIKLAEKLAKENDRLFAENILLRYGKSDGFYSSAA